MSSSGGKRTEPFLTEFVDTYSSEIGSGRNVGPLSDLCGQSGLQGSGPDGSAGEFRNNFRCF